MEICGYGVPCTSCIPVSMDAKDVIITIVALGALAALAVGSLHAGGIVLLGLLGNYGAYGLIGGGVVILSADVIAALIKKFAKSDDVEVSVPENQSLELHKLHLLENHFLEKLNKKSKKVETQVLDWGSMQDITLLKLKKGTLFKGLIGDVPYIGIKTKKKGIQIIQITSAKREQVYEDVKVTKKILCFSYKKTIRAPKMAENCEFTYSISKFKTQGKKAITITFKVQSNINDFSFVYSKENGLVPKVNCPISKDPIVNPFQLQCGHLFDKENLAKALIFKSEKQCPSCMHNIDKSELEALSK